MTDSKLMKQLMAARAKKEQELALIDQVIGGLVGLDKMLNPAKEKKAPAVKVAKKKGKRKKKDGEGGPAYATLIVSLLDDTKKAMNPQEVINAVKVKVSGSGGIFHSKDEKRIKAALYNLFYNKKLGAAKMQDGSTLYGLPEYFNTDGSVKPEFSMQPELV